MWSRATWVRFLFSRVREGRKDGMKSPPTRTQEQLACRTDHPRDVLEIGAQAEVERDGSGTSRDDDTHSATKATTTQANGWVLLYRASRNSQDVGRWCRTVEDDERRQGAAQRDANPSSSITFHFFAIELSLTLDDPRFRLLESYCCTYCSNSRCSG